MATLYLFVLLSTTHLCVTAYPASELEDTLSNLLKTITSEVRDEEAIMIP